MLEPTRTTEEHKRETVFFWLKELAAAQVQYTHLISPYPGMWWIHSTDMMNTLTGIMVDLEHLIEENILKPVNVPYQSQGDWRDRFAPYAYLLTAKGRAILDNPRAWVFRGETKTE